MVEIVWGGFVIPIDSRKSTLWICKNLSFRIFSFGFADRMERESRKYKYKSGFAFVFAQPYGTA